MKRFVGLAFAFGLSACSSIYSSVPNLDSGRNSTQSQPATDVNSQSSEIGQMEEQVRQRINEIRQQQGLTPLQANQKLANVARQYSQQMAKENFFSHTSPAGQSLVQRIKSAKINYTLVGENLFKCTNIPQPVPAAVEGWMNSPGHRKNILRPQYRETGIGVWRDGNTYYFTQLFLRS